MRSEICKTETLCTSAPPKCTHATVFFLSKNKNKRHALPQAHSSSSQNNLSNHRVNFCPEPRRLTHKATASQCQTASENSHRLPTLSQATKLKRANNTSIVLMPPSTNTTMPTWMHVRLVKYYRLLPGHHRESFPVPLPLCSSLLSSPLPAKAGSKNSSELNSHNNMRLSGDRRSTVCAGQYRGSNGSKARTADCQKALW